MSTGGGVTHGTGHKHSTNIQRDESATDIAIAWEATSWRNLKDEQRAKSIFEQQWFVGDLVQTASRKWRRRWR